MQQKLNSLQMKSDLSDPVNDALSYIFNQSKIDKQVQKDKVKKSLQYRESAVPRSKPTQEDLFNEKIKNRP